MKEALLYKKLENDAVRCELCHQNCLIKDGNRGVCGVRQNSDGTLYTLVYGLAIAANVDPIEKKPLNHFLPGSYAYSIATAGCNLRCLFCQNADISQLSKGSKGEIVGDELMPEEAVGYALEYGCQSIAYTYTEPTIFFEYAYDTAKLANEKKLKNVFVTNGFMSTKSLKMMRGYLDAANIDLKSFKESYYQKICGAALKPVLKNIELMREMGIWVEITTLVVPKLNDTKRELGQIAKFLAKLDRNIPWHISRFYPAHKMIDFDVTPKETLVMAAEIGKEAGLNYVYVGNIPGNEYENTICPKCKKVVIDRVNYHVKSRVKSDGKCPYCGYKIAGVFK